MRMLITGVRGGKSCVIHEFDDSVHGEGISSITMLEYPLAALPPRPDGQAPVLDLGAPQGVMRWNTVRFPPNEAFGNHSTNSIDILTVVAGGGEMILDDGRHRLSVGDSIVTTGVDHAWQTGPEGCTVSMVFFSTPPR